MPSIDGAGSDATLAVLKRRHLAATSPIGQPLLNCAQIRAPTGPGHVTPQPSFRQVSRCPPRCDTAPILWGVGFILLAARGR